MTIITLLLFFCHFLGDFVFSDLPGFIKAKETGEPMFIILAHSLVHGALMYLSLMLYNFYLGMTVEDFYLIFNLCTFQIITHFSIDVLKGRSNVWFLAVANPTKKIHWIVFGFDQFLHALVIILMLTQIRPL